MPRPARGEAQPHSASASSISPAAARAAPRPLAVARRGPRAAPGRRARRARRARAPRRRSRGGHRRRRAPRSGRRRIDDLRERGDVAATPSSGGPRGSRPRSRRRRARTASRASSAVEDALHEDRQGGVPRRAARGRARRARVHRAEHAAACARALPTAATLGTVIVGRDRKPCEGRARGAHPSRGAVDREGERAEAGVGGLLRSARGSRGSRKT